MKKEKILTPFYRIVKVLSENEELTITQIELKARVNHRTALLYLGILRENGFIEEERIGRVRVYRINRDNDKIMGLIKFLSSYASYAPY